MEGFTMNNIYRIADIDRNLSVAKIRPLDVLVVGGTGAGKSSTLNVLVILDGSSRDIGTAYKILNEIIIPNFKTGRIIVAINQADQAMKGTHWNEVKNCPDEVLLEFLEKKARSVKERLEEATGIKVLKPVYYSAERNYNIKKLLDRIIDSMPRERRRLV